MFVSTNEDRPVEELQDFGDVSRVMVLDPSTWASSPLPPLPYYLEFLVQDRNG